MGDGSARSVLLVDDSRLDYLNARSLLLGWDPGMRIVWLDHWPGASAVLARGPFDLYIVDVNLGMESGLDVIRDLRGAGVLEPIIAMTGRTEDEVDRACADAGASDFLVKDRIDRETLARSIRYAERQAGTLRELDRLNAALERRAAAESDQARLMRFAIEQSTDALFLSKAGTTLADHAVVYVNAALCRLLECRAGDLLGMDVTALFMPSETAPGMHLGQVIDGHAEFFGAATMKRASGAVHVLLRATPLRPAADETATHYVWSSRDVDETRTAATPGSATSSPASLARLTAGVAHRLNDRLTTIIGNLERAAASPLDDATKRSLAAALHAAEDLVGQARLLAPGPAAVMDGDGSGGSAGPGFHDDRVDGRMDRSPDTVSRTR